MSVFDHVVIDGTNYDVADKRIGSGSLNTNNQYVIGAINEINDRTKYVAQPYTGFLYVASASLTQSDSWTVPCYCSAVILLFLKSGESRSPNDIAKLTVTGNQSYEKDFSFYDWSGNTFYIEHFDYLEEEDVITLSNICTDSSSLNKLLSTGVIFFTPFEVIEPPLPVG